MHQKGNRLSHTHTCIVDVPTWHISDISEYLHYTKEGNEQYSERGKEHEHFKHKYTQQRATAADVQYKIYKWCFWVFFLFPSFNSHFVFLDRFGSFIEVFFIIKGIFQSK